MNSHPVFFRLRRAAWIAVAGLAAWSSASAQETKPQPPSAPYLRNAPTNAVWTVERDGSPKGAAVPQYATLTKTEVTKYGSDRKEVDIWSDGTKVEKWFYQGYHIFEQEGLSDIIVVDRSVDNMMSQAYPDYSKRDFPKLDWLSAESYVGEKPYKGRPAYLFERKLPAPLTSPGAPSTITATVQRVWVDVETRLPSAVETRGEVLAYTYQTSAQGTAAPPERFTKALQQYKDSRTVRTKP